MCRMKTHSTIAGRTGQNGAGTVTTPPSREHHIPPHGDVLGNSGGWVMLIVTSVKSYIPTIPFDVKYRNVSEKIMYYNEKSTKQNYIKQFIVTSIKLSHVNKKCPMLVTHLNDSLS